MKNAVKNYFEKYFGGDGGRRFTIAFGGSLLTIFAFDVIWSLCTSFRALGFATTYIYAFTMAWIMALPSVLWRSRLPQAVVLIAADLLALVNIMYCRTYFGPIPPSSYLLAGNVAEFGDAIVHSLRWYDIVFPAITIATLVMMKKGGKTGAGRLGMGYVHGLCALLAVCCVYALVKRTPFSDIDRLKEKAYYFATPPAAYTLPVSILHATLENATPPDADETVHALTLYTRLDSMKRSCPEPLDSAFTAPKSIVFILVESLEAWPLEATVEGREITPCLNRILADTANVWYGRRVLSQVGPGRSIDGQLLMTAGMMPMTAEIFSMKYPDNTYPHLSQALKCYNGATGYLMSGDRATTWNEGYMAMQFGLDKRYFRDDWDTSESFGHPRNPSDGSLAAQITDRMKAGDIWPEGEAAFVEIITYSSHFPFTIPEKYRRIKLDREYPKPLGDYITAINYTDGAVGELVDYIRGRSDADSTMIVIAGDHEALATYRSEIRRSDASVASLVDEGSFVPLIIINPAVAGRRDAVMGQVDVYPTVLAQAGLTPYAAFGGFGISALSPLSPSYATDLSGNIAGDTVAADAQVLELVRAMPSVSATFIRADLVDNSPETVGKK